MTRPGNEGGGYVATGSGYQMIRGVDIENYRCFRHLSVEGCARVNVIVGDNGAGKTALLEAINLALSSEPNMALKARHARNLDGAFNGSARRIQEALWGSYFHNLDMTRTISIRLHGSGPEARSVELYTGYVDNIIPLDDIYNWQNNANLLIRWINAAGQPYDYKTSVSSQGLQHPGSQESLPDFHFFSSHFSMGSTELANIYSDLSRKGEAKLFLSMLQAEYPWINGLSLETLASSPVLHASVNGSKVLLPLNDLSGAINRISGVLLSILSRPQSVVLVDEIENGVYFKHMPGLWSAIVASCRTVDGQIFVTTHSEEWIRAIALDNDQIDDIAFWRVTRGEDGPTVRRYSRKAIRAAINSGGEVR